MKLLIIEDDKDVAYAIKSAFSQSHVLEISPDGNDGSFLARNYDYDAIILDYSLPKKNGLMVMRDIRSSGKSTPVIFLSSTTETNIKIEALEAGADDYLTKPFSMQELRARIEAITRRPKAVAEKTYSVGPVALDVTRHRVTVRGKELKLTTKEFNLLEYMLKNPGVVLSRSLLMEHVWTAESSPFSNTIESHMRNVRKKLRDAHAPDLIYNIPGRGYILELRDKDKR